MSEGRWSTALLYSVGLHLLLSLAGVFWNQLGMQCVSSLDARALVDEPSRRVGHP